MPNVFDTPGYRESRVKANNQKRMTIFMSPESIRALRVFAAQHDTSQARVLEFWIQRYALGDESAVLRPELRRGRPPGRTDTVPRGPYGPRKKETAEEEPAPTAKPKRKPKTA